MAVGGFALGNISASASTNVDYTIKSGDTLSKIADAFDTTVDRLAKDNNIKNVNLIYANEHLQILDGTQEVTTAPVQQVSQPVQNTQTEQVAQQQTTVATQTTQVTTTVTSDAKSAIVNRESGGSYTAQNGRYYGKYQLDISYLHGDLSPANQDATADAYVAQRYGSWENAWAHSQATGWY